ncbi:MAG: hypothetical protein RLY16_114 [Bacteroidota bacterium]|jgi:ABC-type bacteriocin/lantibiotic exporter with double-glycine peptidase domain
MPTTAYSNPIQKILKVIQFEKNEISSIYFYAILNGLIQLSLPLGIQSIISFVLGGAISTSLILLICFVVIGVFLNGLVQVNQMKLIEKVQQKIFVRYSFQLTHSLPFIHLQKADAYYLPELTNRFFDVVTLQKGISKLLLDMPAATIQICFGILLLSLYHPVFIFFGISLLLVVFVILKLTGSKGMESSLRESDYKYEVAGWLEEMARVIHSFKFMRNPNFAVKKADDLLQGYLFYRTRHFKVLLFQYWTLIGLKLAITAAMLIAGCILLVNQQLNVGQFIAAEIVILMVIASVEKIVINLDTVYDTLTAVAKIAKLTQQTNEENGTTPLISENKAIAIQLENIQFSYSANSTAPVLKDISLDIKPAEKICLMGSGGSGKSTLLKLLSTIYTEFSGNYYLNGVALSKYDLASLRAAIGLQISHQDVIQGSLYDNIVMGNQDVPKQQISEIAGKIGLMPFLKRFPEGLETMVQPNGQSLSKSFKQKLLLLRAIIGQPRLLLLEDPFEGLQPDACAAIQQYILHEMPNTTLIVSTNNKDFAAQCNRIVLLSEGQISATGSFNQLQQLFQ